MNYKFVVLSIAIYAALLSYTGAFLISQTATWGSCSGGSQVNCEFSTNSGTNPITKWVRWGIKLQNQTTTSGLGFQVANPANVDAVSSTPFLLGKLTHDNLVVGGRDNLATRVALRIDMTFNVNGNNYPFTFNTQISIDETLNQPTPLQNGYCIYQDDWQSDYNQQYDSSRPCCPYPSSPSLPCSDKIQSTVVNAQELVIDNVRYQILIFGFGSSADPATATFQPTANFVSQEQQSNSAFLFGRLIVSCLSGSSEACNNGLSDYQKQCSSGRCSNGQCVFSVANSNQACTPDNACTTGARCVAGPDGTGACQGSPAANGASCQLSGGATLGPCLQAVCSNGQCAPRSRPDGVTSGCSGNTNNECTQFQCQAGQCIETGLDKACSNADPLGSGKDVNCNTKRCQNGRCRYIPANYGTNCGSGGPFCAPTKCDAGGSCSSFVNEQNGQACSGPTVNDNNCQYAACNGGSCQLFNRNGENGGCSGGVSGNNCQRRTCVNGACTTAGANNGATCGNPSNNCTTLTCQNGNCVTGNAGSNVQCGSNINDCHFRYCDGNGNCRSVYPNYQTGSCSGRNPSNDCQNRICDGNGNCGTVNRNNGNTCSSVSAGNCQAAQCQSGTCTRVVNQNNVGTCATATCKNPACDSSGNCIQTNQGRDTPCGFQNNDPCRPQFCDGSGNCVLQNARATNQTCTNQVSGDPNPTSSCQSKRCDGAGNCRTMNYTYATPACQADNNTRDCRTFQCQSGQCVWAAALGSACSDNNPCTTDTCDTAGNCNSVANDTLSCPSGSGNLGACQVWGCRSSQCVPVNSRNGTCTDNNACTSDSCTDSGQCIPTNLDGTTSCTFIGTVPECRKPGCQGGSCSTVPDRTKDGIACQINTTRECYAKECNNGDCVAISVVGNPCQRTNCREGVCSGPDTCDVTFKNEGEVCESNDAEHCSDKVCQSGDCVLNPQFFDGKLCQIKNLCQSYQCFSGICNTSYVIQLPEGTACITSPFTCRQWACDALGNCIQSVDDGAYCFEPEETFKRQAATSSFELPECKAYQCDSGACTSTIIDQTATPCERNFTSPCLEALCVEGVCSPVVIDDCDECEEFQDCDSCLTGTFKRQDVPTGSSTNGCVWCRGTCKSEDLYLELVNLTQIEEICSPLLSGCPLIPEEDDGGDDNRIAIIVGTIGGAAVLAALLGLAAAIAFVIWKKQQLAELFPSTNAFASANVVNDNPIAEAALGAQSSPIFN